MAPLQGAHVILGCGTDRTFRPHTSGHRQKEQIRHTSRGVAGRDTRRQIHRKTQGELTLVFLTAKQ